MAYDDDDFLTISGIQHFAFCRRQWALIFVECLWADNVLTTSGTLMHSRTHDASIKEKRGNLLISRDMAIFSRVLGITGKCDVVEFHQNEKDGVKIFGRDGNWLPIPVEYKRGEPKKNDADKLQLCAQTICLEEMLNCPPIKEAYLFYGEIKRRETVVLDEKLRKKVTDIVTEMRGYHQRGYTPKVKPTKACASCSMQDECLPNMNVSSTVGGYINAKIT